MGWLIGAISDKIISFFECSTPAKCTDKHARFPNPIPLSHNHLDLDGALQRFPTLLHTSVRLGAHNTTAPVTNVLLVLLEVAILDCRDKLGEFRLVFGSNLSKSNDSSGLQPHG